MLNTPLEKKILIGGRWVDSESGDRYELRSPGDNSVIGTVPKCTRKDVHHAVEAAKEGKIALKKMSLKARIHLLDKAMEIGRKRVAEAEKILCLESGKTIMESRSEAGSGGYSWDNIRMAGESAKLYRGQTLPNNTEDSNNKRILVNQEPVDIVANISTFSYPSEMPNCSIPYALAIGTSVIVKPSRSTPYSAIILCEIMAEAGFPPGSINVITGAGDEVGDELVTHPDIEAITFFGQKTTGEKITQKAGFKKQLMAIVSSNPLIVMDDANITEAVTSAIGGAFPMAGQSPIATRRIMLHQDIRKEFMDQFVSRTKALNLGHPMDEKTDVGPLNNEVVLETAMQHLADATEKGGTFITGGNNIKGLYLEPTIIENVTPDMLVMQEGTPGPIVPVTTFSSMDEVIEMANSTCFGFQFGIFTSSLKNAFYLSENAKAGSVYINEATSCWEEMAAFGGVKCSGKGRMLSTWVLDQLTNTKMTMFDLEKTQN
jgi:acyl-CoA reductase-like NAD-dependent aldehyde dehydrogenase